jgi:ferrous iron transport protein A
MLELRSGSDLELYNTIFSEKRVLMLDEFAPPEIKPLTEMRVGEIGRIVEIISGGFGMMQRLDAMGIRCGKQIKKMSSQLMRGPVVFQVDNTQVALGYGMARKIMVKLMGLCGD